MRKLDVPVHPRSISGAKVVAADFQCVGNHGIGRFAEEVFRRIHFEPIAVAVQPTSPVYGFYLARALSEARPAFFFSPSYMPPLWSAVPFVFTIHDLNHIDRPENSSLLKRLYYSLFLKSGCRRAAKICTVSEFSRKRILEWTGLPPDKVVNVGNGVDPRYSADGDRYQPGYRYFLCVSNRRGHKNEESVVRALSATDNDPDVKVAFTGDSTSGLLSLADECGVRDRIVFLGKVPEDQLPSLYRGAIALLFPSFYEGFGLPVVEAMACGTPVITSNTTSLPEVAGGAALLVDPTSVSQLSAMIKLVLSDRALVDDMRVKGLLRAKDFSWDDVAARVDQVLANLGTQQS